MSNNKIQIYQNNARTIGCYVHGGLDLTDFTPYLTVKTKAASADVVLEKIGMVTDPSTTLTFDLLPADTSIAAGEYVYDITIENGSVIYTIVKDGFAVLDGVRY